MNTAMELYKAPYGSYDIVFSSLAIHYVEDYNTLIYNISSMLRTNAYFVFSIEHPVYTAQEKGWEIDGNNQRLYWKLSSYANEGKRTVEWLGFNVEKYHRKVETYINSLINQDFAIECIIEPQPDSNILHINPNLEYELMRPPYLIISATKK